MFYGTVGRLPVNVFKMAWRNVWRNHRRSLITIAAMTLALAVELLYSGIVVGMMHGMEDDVTENEMGDVQIFQEGYLTRPSVYDTIPHHEDILARLDEAGYRSSARLFSGGLAASGDTSAGVGFIGIDPVRDAKTLSLSQAVGEGQWLSNDDPKGILIGRGLARTLGAGIGSEIVILSQSTDGGMANDLFTVRGVLMSVAAGMDRSTVLMTEGAFRELMILPDGAHKIIVRRPKDVELQEAKSHVQSIVAAVSTGGPALDVMTWRELSPFLAQWLESVSSVVTIMYLIIYVAVGILILNAMLMAVFERIQEFGVLKAIGYSPFQVLTMMVSEGLIQAAIAAVVGLLIAAPGMWYLQVHGIDVGVLGGIQMVGMTMPAIWRGYYTVGIIKVPIIMLFVIVLAAVIYPALKAAWIRPVEAMHHA